MPSLPSLACQLYHNVPTHLAPGPDGTPRTIHGVTGFTKATVAKYVKEDPYYADQQPLTAAEKPPPEPIIIHSVFQQCQASTCGVQCRGQYNRPT